MELRDDGATLFDHLAGNGRMLSRGDLGEYRGNHPEGGDSVGESGPVAGRVDAEGQPADDDRSGGACG